MSLKSVHPHYALFLPEWVSMRDFHKGEIAVKDKGTAYLPATAGMEIDGMLPNQIGWKIYQAYKSRAVFPDYVKEGVESLMGLIHQHDAKIELPARMEYLRKRATVGGESLLMLLRKINEEQLISGRLGLLVDLPENPDPTNPEPFISIYGAESIINWDDSSSELGLNELQLVVLDESGYVRDEFAWKFEQRYRVLQLWELVGDTYSNVSDGGVVTQVYWQGTFEGEDYSKEAMIAPILRGVTLNKIPFVFINSKISKPKQCFSKVH